MAPSRCAEHQSSAKFRVAFEKLSEAKKKIITPDIRRNPPRSSELD